MATELAGWALTWLLHGTVVLGGLRIAERAGWLCAPRARDVLWKAGLVGSVVTATLAVARPVPGTSPGIALQTVELTREVEGAVARRSAPDGAPGTMALRRGSVAGVVRAVAGGAAGGVSGHPVVPASGARFPAGGAGPRTGPPAAGEELRLTLRRARAPGAPGRAGGRPTPIDARGGELSAACRAALAGGTVRPEAVRGACMPARAAVRWGLLVWLLGAMVGGGRLLAAHRAVRRIRRESRPAPVPVQRTLYRLGGPPALRVRTHPALSAPCYLGGGVIGLPCGPAGHALPPEELRAVLAHEVAHAERGDLAWRVALAWTGALLWFQPLARLAARAVAEASEELCDDRALERTRHPLGLARSISRLAAAGRPFPGAALAVGVGGRGSVESRVARILAGSAPGPRGSGRRALLLAALLLSATAALPPVRLPAPRVAVFFGRTTDVAEDPGAVVATMYVQEARVGP